MSPTADAPRLRSFADCRGSCRGPVFIIASGPSAHDFPLAQYARYPMMALNGSIRAFLPLDLRPFFYLCDDSTFPRGRYAIFEEALPLAQHLALSQKVLDVAWERSPAVLAQASLYLFDRVNREGADGKAMSDRCFAWRARRDPDITCRFSWLRQKDNRIGFCRNMEKGFFSSRTIPYAGIQLAYHLGFNQVFLVGVDMNSAAGRFYAEGDNPAKSRLDGDYDDYILPCFQLMAEQVVNPSFRVYNLSLDSRLPDSVVPKLTLAQLDALLASPAAA